MALALITRRGGGTSLNFRIVGGATQPTSPKENTIWVNADVDITGWAFSATEPESPVEGMVWFNIGTLSAAPINALKKNTLMLYPFASQQYIDGEWASKTSKTYQGGKWVPWMVYFFKHGWVAPYTGLNAAKKNHQDEPPDVEMTYDESGNLVLNRHSWNGASWDGNSWVYSKETVDLTNVSKICCKTADIGSGDAIYLGVAAGTDANTTKKVQLTESNTVYELDVTALTGNYYYGFYHRNSTEGNWLWTDRVIAEIYYT